MTETTTQRCTTEPIVYHGWDALKLKNQMLEVVAVPEIGGRMMQFKLGPHDFVFRNPELLGKRFTFEEHAGDGTILNWKNYGGEKVWPAPQGWNHAGQWAGPPDPVLDGGRYTAEMNTPQASIRMVSPPDTQRTGLRVTREITLYEDDARLQFNLCFENMIERPIQWSIWQIAQLDCALDRDGKMIPNNNCWLYIPTNQHPPYQVMFGDKNPQLHGEIAPGLMAVEFLGIVGKIGVTNTAGWVAFADQTNDFVACIRFDYQQGMEYPDGGASIECWTESPGASSPIPIRSPGYLMEAEILSPLFTLQPGESKNFTTVWCAAHCPGPIIDVTEIGCVHQILKAVKSGEWVNIQGVFGCFVTGKTELIWLDSTHKIVGKTDLGIGSPLKTLLINQVEAYPENAAQVQLRLRDVALAQTSII